MVVLSEGSIAMGFKAGSPASSGFSGTTCALLQDWLDFDVYEVGPAASFLEDGHIDDWQRRLDGHQLIVIAIEYPDNEAPLNHATLYMKLRCTVKPVEPSSFMWMLHTPHVGKTR